mgnify:CR=1 FL=1
MQPFKLNFTLSFALFLALCGVAFADDQDQGDTRWFYRYIDQQSGGESFETYSWGDVWYLTHLGSGLELIRVQENESRVFIPQGNLSIGYNEGSAARLDLSGVDLTIAPLGELNISSDVNVDRANANITLQHTGSAEQGWHAEERDVSYIRETSGPIWIIKRQDDSLGIGELGAEASYVSVNTDGTGNSEFRVPTDSIGIQELDAKDEPADAESYTYDSATGRGEWESGAGAPTDATYITQTANGTLSAEQALESLSTGIMRVATTTGVITSLTTSTGISDNLSDETGTGGALVFASSPTITTPVFTTSGEASGTVPRYVWTDTTASADDYELWVDGNIAGFSNTTEGTQVWGTTQSSQLETLTQLITRGGVDFRGIVDGRNASVVSFIQQFDKTIVDPDGAQTTSDAYPLFEVEAFNYPYGITVTAVKLSTNASSSAAYNLEEWTSPGDGAPSTITGMVLVSQSERFWTGTAIVDASVAAGSYIAVDLDTTALNWAKVTVWFYANTA